ncbi:MAG: hypothetical protein IPO51_14910 [Dehalococcoidia bacterium]|nr:hypothetical protein [Dehalococcoidia bacterium]
MGIRKPPGTTKRPPDGRKKLSTKRPRLVPPGHIAPLPPLERRLDSHPGPDEDFPEVPPGHDILQAPDDELLDRLVTLIGTIKPGQSLYEALDLDSLVHLGWLRRGQAEIDRVAAAPARRHIRASERPYVRWARLCGGLPTSAAPLVGENPSGADWPRHRLRLHPLTADAYLAALAEGISHGGAAGRAGVHPDTVTRWLEKGRAAIERAEAGEDLDADSERYAVFVTRTWRVLSDLEVEMVASVRLGARGWVDANGAYVTDRNGRPVMTPDWRAALEYLKYRRGRDWRLTDAVGDESSAAVQAARSGRPTQVVVHHSATALSDGPIDVERYTVAADHPVPRRALTDGVPEPDNVVEVTEGEGPAAGHGENVEEIGG